MEALAFRLLQIDSTSAILISWLIVLISAWISISISSFEFKIGRAIYFFGNGFLFFVSGISTAAIYGLPSAIKDGYVTLIVVLIYGAIILIGSIGGVLAAARSRDAYEVSAKWFYGFVPLLNLVLIFAKSTRNEQKNLSKTVFNLMGIIAGLMLMGAGKAISVEVQKDTVTLFEFAYRDTALMEKIGELAAKTPNGLETFLKESIAGLVVPTKVDGITTLTNVEVKGDVIRYKYSISSQDFVFGEAWHDLMMNRWCKSENFKAMMSWGATVEGEFIVENRKTTEIVKVNKSDCQKWNNEFEIRMVDNAKSIKGPQRIDDVTVFEYAEYKGRYLNYNYIISVKPNDEKYLLGIPLEQVHTIY